MELYALQEVLDRFSAHPATLVALTPQLPEHSAAMVAKHGLDFDILSDPGNAYAAELGLRFALPEALRAIYSAFGIDLPKCNGEGSWTLPMPGRIVVGADGVVKHVDVDPDYTVRPEPDTTLAALAGA
ncbi:MAG: redoxin domain-containing protein [Gammaproteobacteria bacterium]|nr:redoxin domain-containing protein [Gammaproteobacteria bacterium]MCP5199101.1 redoxin domain-containing protein [Gammaproteobacteria bacterium]